MEVAPPGVQYFSFEVEKMLCVDSYSEVAPKSLKISYNCQLMSCIGMANINVRPLIANLKRHKA